jgi:hypothetical protein
MEEELGLKGCWFPLGPLFQRHNYECMESWSLQGVNPRDIYALKKNRY